MAKYRVLRIETKDSADRIIKIEYSIKKKFLWFWVTARIKGGYRLGTFGGGASAIMLKNYRFILNSQHQAQMFIDKYLTNFYSEKYLGNRIIRIVNERNFEELFVNKSNIVEYYAGRPCYESSDSLDRLKSQIESRIRTTKKTFL